MPHVEINVSFLIIGIFLFGILCAKVCMCYYSLVRVIIIMIVIGQTNELCVVIFVSFVPRPPSAANVQ